MVVLAVAVLWIGSTLAAESSSCVSPSISVEEKVRLNADNNDFDNNLATNGTDIAYDLSNNYDINDDGAVSEAEWIARYTCAYGDSSYFARFIFNMISRGTAEIRISVFTDPGYDRVFTREEFMNLTRRRYELFVTDNCVNTNLTRDEKVNLILKYDNHNNDSVVDSSDTAYNLGNNYDFDQDGNITQVEWVVRWCCAIGDTSDYARFVWGQLFQGADSIQADYFSGRPPFDTGIPLATFRARSHQRYESYDSEGQPPVGK